MVAQEWGALPLDVMLIVCLGAIALGLILLSFIMNIINTLLPTALVFVLERMGCTTVMLTTSTLAVYNPIW